MCVCGGGGGWRCRIAIWIEGGVLTFSSSACLAPADLPRPLPLPPGKGRLVDELRKRASKNSLEKTTTEEHQIPQTIKSLGLLHKTFIGEKNRVKFENSGKHNVAIDFTIGRKKNLVKITSFSLVFSLVKVLCNLGPLCAQ